MNPAGSVSGLYLNQPDSKYFGVGKLGQDQVADYASHNGQAVVEAEKWFGPWLDYDPS